MNELNNETLPEGTRLHVFMDRTNLVDTTLHTVSHTLLEGMALVVLVLILFLGSWRGALLIAFILMHLTDIPANLLSLGAIPGAADVAIDQEPPLPQLQIVADRDRIAQYGLNFSDVADMIELAIGGKAISQIFVGSKSYDVICRFDDASRNTPESIGNMLLTNGAGAKIPLSQVAEVKMTTGASTISREMNRRHLTIHAPFAVCCLWKVPASRLDDV